MGRGRALHRQRRWPLLPMAIALLLGTAPARGEPYLAVYEGLKCTACHVNRTGGGKRTGFGAHYAATWLRADAPAEDVTPVPGRVNPWLALGADLRADYRYVDEPPAPIADGFAVRDGLLYVEATLEPARTTLYLDQRVAPGGATAREAFALLAGLPATGYVKAGRFFLPYGLRLQDDAAFVREVPGMGYDRQEEGVELGLQPGAWSLHLAVTNGADGAGESNRDKRVTGMTVHVTRRTRLGASVMHNVNDAGVTRDAWNLLAGTRLGPVVLLTEVDTVRDAAEGTVTSQRAALLEADWLLRPGHNLRLGYGRHDPDLTVDDDLRHRYTLVLEVFWRRSTQVRLGGHVREASNGADARAVRLFSELHLFF